jgi:hypothetical protein
LLLADGVVPRNPKDLLAGRLEERLALGVVLASELVVMPAGAVGLHDQALGGPAKVRHKPAASDDQGLAYIWSLETTSEDQIEHDIFENAARRCVPIGDHLGKPAGSSPRPGSSNHLNELTDPHLALRHRLANRSAERRRWKLTREIQESACRRCDSDPFMRHHVLALETAALVHPDSRMPRRGRGRYGDLWPPAVPLDVTPMSGGRVVAERARWPACLDGG